VSEIATGVERADIELKKRGYLLYDINGVDFLRVSFHSFFKVNVAYGLSF